MQAALKRSVLQLSTLVRAGERRKDDAPRLALAGGSGSRSRSQPITLDPAQRTRRLAAQLIVQQGEQQLISAEHAVQLAALLHWRSLGADDDVFGLGGAQPGSLALLTCGEVRVEMDRAPHQPVVWSMHLPGQWLGELPPSHQGCGQSHSDAATGAAMRYLACGDIEVGVLPLASLNHLLLNHPALAASLLLLVSHQLGLQLRASHDRALLQHQWMVAAAAPDAYLGRDTELDIQFD
jgi:hypothetical protein